MKHWIFGIKNGKRYLQAIIFSLVLGLKISYHLWQLFGCDNVFSKGSKSWTTSFVVQLQNTCHILTEYCCTESTTATEWIPLNYLTGDVWRSGEKKKGGGGVKTTTSTSLLCKTETCSIVLFSLLSSTCHFSQSLKLGLTEQITCLLVQKEPSKYTYKNSH